jgi:hypothetical protein
MIKERGERSEADFSASCTIQRGGAGSELQYEPLIHLFYFRVETDSSSRPTPGHNKLQKYIEEIYFVHGHMSTV